MHTDTENKITTEYGGELKSITKSAGFGALGMFFMTIMAFVSNIVITRNLGVELYGLFVLVTNIFSFIVLISQLGFTNTIIRFVSFYLGQNKDAMTIGTIQFSFKLLLFFSLIVFIISQIAAPYISDYIFKRPEITYLLRILLFSIPFSVMATVSYAVLNGLRLIKIQVIAANILNPIIFFVLIILNFGLEYSLTGLIWIMFIMGPVNFTLSYYFLNKKYLSKKKNIKPTYKKEELFRFAMPLYLNQFLNSGIKFIPIFIMGYFLANEDVGVFNVAFKIAMLVSVSLGVFKLIFAPTISTLFAKNNKQLIAQLYKTITKWIFTISLITVGIIVLFSESILNIFGADFSAGVDVLLLLIFGELVNASVGLVGNIIIMSGRPKVALINSSVNFVMIIVLCYFLIPNYGIIGTALSYTITIAFINIIRLLELFYFERMHPFKFSYFKPIVAGIIGFIIVYFMKNLFSLNANIELIFGTLFFVALVILLLWILRIDNEDKYILESILKKIKKK